MKVKNMLVVLTLVGSVSANAALKLRGEEALRRAREAAALEIVRADGINTVNKIINAMIANITAAQNDVDVLDRGLGELEEASRINSDQITKLARKN